MSNLKTFHCSSHLTSLSLDHPWPNSQLLADLRLSLNIFRWETPHGSNSGEDLYEGFLMEIIHSKEGIGGIKTHMEVVDEILRDEFEYDLRMTLNIFS